jgi:mycofactocin precursor peptide peptidase
VIPVESPVGGSSGDDLDLGPGRRFGALTWPEAGRWAASGAILAVPLGSTEQHGPHLPVSTDTEVAVALCDRLAAAHHDVLVAPALSYGASGEHEAFPGTLSIGQAALETVLVELCRSATRSLAGVVLVCAHGGNAATMARAERRLTAEDRRVLAWSATWTGDAHAGRTETSLMLALTPRTVHLARAQAGAVDPLGTLMDALRAGSLRTVSPNGVLGDPAGASAGEGATLLDRLGATLASAVAQWRASWRPSATGTAPGAAPGAATGGDGTR